MIRKALVLFALVSIASFAHAQLGIYGTVSVVHLGGINSSPCLVQTATGDSLNCVGPTPVPQTPPLVLQSNVNTVGGTFGGYYEFRNLGPARLGIDLRAADITGRRGSQSPADGSGTHLQSYLAGIRASFHTPISAIKPYVQASAGLGRSDYGFLRVEAPTSVNYGRVLLTNNFEYHIYAGADIHIAPLLDFRIVEVGYGGLDPFGTYAHNYSLGSLSTGIVFHLPSLK